METVTVVHRGVAAFSSFTHEHPDTSDDSYPSHLDSHPRNCNPQTPHTHNTCHARLDSRTHLRNPSASVRSRTETVSSVTSEDSSFIRRKPLPRTASPLATRFSSAEDLPTTPQPPGQSFVRPYAVDSPTLHEFPPTARRPDGRDGYALQNCSEPSNEPLDLTPGAASLTGSSDHQANREQHRPSPRSPKNLSIAPSHGRAASTVSSQHARGASEASVSDVSSPWYSDSSSRTCSQSSVFSATPAPTHQVDVPASHSYATESDDSIATIRKAPASPSRSRIGSLFSWAVDTSSGPEKPPSPLPSPRPGEKKPAHSGPATAPGKKFPRAIDVPKANADVGGYLGSAYHATLLASPTTPLQVEQMETELREISAELAASIRREMDLEDLVERLQADALNLPASAGKRTSDYFSDSGTSSIRYGDLDFKQEELDRMLRKAEQEKAQVTLDLTTKVQDERARRQQLEAQIRTLEEKASQVDLASMNRMDAHGRVRDLEATCEDLRRRLADERQVKDNFEDLLTALRGELESSHNERDNLRDEIVPGLRARVEGLEAQAAEHEKLRYEQTKMQQEVQTLKSENLTLIQAQRLQMEMQQQMTKFNTIAEEAEPAALKTPRTSGLSRSDSAAQGALTPRNPKASLSRSNSAKAIESRDSLAERVKEVELQRDALHKALKNLLERQEHQNRENEKRIRQLEIERDRALSSSPKRMGYEKEVANLREEINTLRRRADEAIEQKWQCEKGLSGLKMDLERAEQEISSLRSLLDEHDILVPTQPLERTDAGAVSSESLERAYRELQRAYSQSLQRVKNLELASSMDDGTREAMRAMEKSLADATTERDFAQREAEALREQSGSLRDAEKRHVDNEIALAEELRRSAKRVEDLAVQVRSQLSSNSTLRHRLSETIQRGEREQSLNAEKIIAMQSKLKSLEDQLVAAQQISEDKVSRHEDEIRQLKESHHVQLQRTKEGRRSSLTGPKSHASPLFSNSARAPRVLSTSSGQAMTVSEDSQLASLRQRVADLESALAKADSEMEEVVSRMNIAQIEVMELQNEREEAVRETRRLQRQIEQEKVRAANLSQ
ncbi:intracellular protein transport-like protein [Diplocarpon rosae]|nr:intracellular protein transport-like protein [Diplocarpon rosae]